MEVGTTTKLKSLTTVMVSEVAHTTMTQISVTKREHHILQSQGEQVITAPVQNGLAVPSISPTRILQAIEAKVTAQEKNLYNMDAVRLTITFHLMLAKTTHMIAITTIGGLRYILTTATHLNTTRENWSATQFGNEAMNTKT